MVSIYSDKESSAIRPVPPTRTREAEYLDVLFCAVLQTCFNVRLEGEVNPGVRDLPRRAFPPTPMQLSSIAPT